MQFISRDSVNRQLAICSLVFLLFCNRGAAGQTEAQLEARFKKLVVLEIRPGIDVFTSFAANGSVCQMVIEKRQYLEGRNSDFDNTIPSALANQLVDELVPPSERGKPSSPYLSSESFIAGGASFIKQDYENVSVAMYGRSVDGKVSGARAIIIDWPKRVCPRAR